MRSPMAAAHACTCRTPGASGPTAARRCRAFPWRSSTGASLARHPTTPATGASAMLLAATEYVRPDSLEDALAALGETRLAMDFEIVEQRPSEYVRISGVGSPGENQLQLSIELDLGSDGEQTVASWSADVQLRGVLRSLLQRGLGSLFNEQVEAVLSAGALLSEACSER